MQPPVLDGFRGDEREKKPISNLFGLASFRTNFANNYGCKRSANFPAELFLSAIVRHVLEGGGRSIRRSKTVAPPPKSFACTAKLAFSRVWLSTRASPRASGMS